MKRRAWFDFCLLFSSAWLISPSASAETWTTALTIQSITPMASWPDGNGVVRVKLSSNVVTGNCGTTDEIDFAYSGGTSESRAAVISALYVAFATDRSLRFALSDTTCSSTSQPLFTGVNIPR